MSQFSFLDYALIVVTVAFAALGLRRGFGKTASGTVGILIAVIIAIVGANGLSPWFTNCMRTVVSATLKSKIHQWAPKLSKDICSEIAWGVMSTLQNSIIHTLLFTILLLIGVTVWLYACYHYGLSGKFPEAKNANQLFGAVCGLLKGLVVILVTLYILAHLGIIAQKTLDKSVLIQRLSKLITPPQ